jgi:hypothetical protein
VRFEVERVGESVLMTVTARGPDGHALTYSAALDSVLALQLGRALQVKAANEGGGHDAIEQGLTELLAPPTLDP